MALYKFSKNSITGEVESVIKKLDNNRSLHILLSNTESTNYQEYLEWVAEGNTADPAD